MKKSSERRSSLRKPIHHDAMMLTRDGFGLNCTITDFCLDGMFVKFFGGASARLQEFPDFQTKSAQVSLVFSGENGQEFKIRAEIAHSIEGACGLRFTQRYDQAVQSLINASISMGVTIDLNVSSQKIIQKCIACIYSDFGSLLEKFWGELAALLQAEAVKASDDQTANKLMALSEKIIKTSDHLQKEVLLGIQDPVEAFNAHLEKRKSMSDKLSLIDKEEFEDWLLARVLIMKSESNYQSLLLPLKLRLDALGVGDKRHHQSVFGPALLVSAFQPVVQSLIVDSVIEKQIFRLFEETVMTQLSDLYNTLNDILIEHNVLPKMDVKRASIVKNLQPPKPKVEYGTSDNHEMPPVSQKQKDIPLETADQLSVNPKREDEASVSRAFTLPPFSQSSSDSVSGNSNSIAPFSENQRNAQLALRNIDQLLKNLRPSSKSSDSGEPLKPMITPSEFKEELSLLQSANVANREVEEIPSLMERVSERLKLSGNERDIGGQHKVAIDVVDRFFMSMRRNPRISDEAKKYLLKLDVPILKVLLKDEMFFANHQSTVRAVMNRIAQIGAKGSKLHPSTRDKLEMLVNKVVAEFDEDTKVFDEALTALDEMVERHNTAFVKNVERVTASAESAFKVEEADAAVTEAINQRIAHKFVPTAVITLINQGWEAYLKYTHINQGGDSVAWQEGLSVIDRLIAFADDPRIPLDIRVILPKIQEGLKKVSCTEVASNDIREALKAFIMNAPKGMHLCEQAQQLVLPETEEDRLRRNISKSQELKDWILKVKSFALGAWFRFEKKNNETTYIRLVWVAKGFSKFVFVNHQGMSVIELGLFKLASYFKDGLLVLESDYELPIVNQGLDDMVKDVYDRLAFESSHDSGTGLIKSAEFCRQVRLLMKNGKRTASCSLLLIRFTHEEKIELTLPEDFTKKTVRVLEGLVATEKVIGKVDDDSFVLFAVLEDANNFRSKCQEALILLCNQQEYLKHKLIVSLGESRAHLGFQNPESMIKHAAEALDSVSPANIETGNQDQPPVLQSIEEGVGQQPSGIPILLSDEAANIEQADVLFANLEFDIYGQTVSEIVANNEISKEKSQGRSEKKDVQLNLLCAVKGESIYFSAETESVALELDSWWLQKLENLCLTDSELIDRYDCIRVSLSAYVFNDQARVDTLLELAQTNRLNAKKICFDIYDCYQINDAELAAIRMKSLREKGYRFCLEHFGTPRCPFAFLKALPADIIKIDDSFISAFNSTQTDVNDSGDELMDEQEASADSIVEIAHYMGKRVLAASVDSAVCLQKMKHLKVDYVQGSTVAKAVKYEF